MSNFKQIFESRYTWIEGFMRNVRRYANRVAMIESETEKTWTYSQLNADVNRLCNALKGDGMRPGDTVMLQMVNRPEFAFAYVACHKMQSVCCPVSYRISTGELAYNIDDSKPFAIIVCESKLESVLEAIKLANHAPKRIIVASDKELPYATRYNDYVSGVSDAEYIPETVYNIYDETCRLYTSGTTGRPKGVAMTSINEVLSAHDAIMHYPLNCKDICMNMTPLFHRGGSHSGGTCPTFFVGATLVLMRSFSPRTTLQYIEKYGITFLTGSPATLEMLAHVQEKTPFDLSKLKGLVTMGAPLEKAACKKYLEILTPNILNGYGTTETFWNSFLRPYDLPDYAGTVGGSCIDDEVRVVKIYDDRKAEPDEIVPMDNETVGEVIISSPGKTTYSYYKNPEEQENKYYKGWMYTNDLGYWDENRYVTINGRKDDMIVCSAENIYPTQIEEILNEYEKVADSMVTSVPDKVRGQVVVAYVVAKDPELTVADLAKYCNEHPMLSTYKRPRWYRIVDSLPHTATGKKMHYVIKQQAAEDLKNGLLKRK